MRCAIIISFYDEYEEVAKSIIKIKNYFKKEVDIYTVQSAAPPSSLINGIQIYSYYTLLPNLGSLYNRYELPSQCITRNFSAGFSDMLNHVDKHYDYIVAFTGDTLIKDPSSFERRFQDMKSNNKVALVSQAIGQYFNSEDKDRNMILASRFQDDNSTDFACCFWIMDGKFVKDTNAFRYIEITNKYTSE